MHWYQTLFEAAWTQVRGGTDLPSVAELHHAKLCEQPEVEEIAVHEPLSHWYQLASLADCTQVPSSTSRSSVEELQLAPPRPDVFLIRSLYR